MSLVYLLQERAASLRSIEAPLINATATMDEVSRTGGGGMEASRLAISPVDFSELKRPTFLKKIKSGHVDNGNPVVENLNVKPKLADDGTIVF